MQVILTDDNSRACQSVLDTERWQLVDKGRGMKSRLPDTRCQVLHCKTLEKCTVCFREHHKQKDTLFNPITVHFIGRPVRVSDESTVTGRIQLVVASCQRAEQRAAVRRRNALLIHLESVKILLC